MLRLAPNGFRNVICGEVSFRFSTLRIGRSMKGIVFTVFIDFAEQRFGEQRVQEAIFNCHLPTGGAYTAVGTYDHGELVSLLLQLADTSAVPPGDLLSDFGVHLFAALAGRYPGLVGHYTDSFSMLESIETVIHAEVLKLYPDAELPEFTYERISPSRLHLTYRSARGLGRLVDGLLRACFAHFGETVELSRTDLSNGREMQVLFELQRHPESP